VTKNGKPTQKTTISISDDGKTRTSQSEVFPADGEPFSMTMISERVSGGAGLAGEWREVQFSSSQVNGVLSIAVKGDTVDFKETDSSKPITCKLDGTEAKFPDGGTMSVKLADPHTLKVTYKDDDGKVRRQNTFRLPRQTLPRPRQPQQCRWSFTRYRGRFRSDDRQSRKYAIQPALDDAFCFTEGRPL